MTQDTVTDVTSPADSLTNFLRNKARGLLAEAFEEEAQ